MPEIPEFSALPTEGAVPEVLDDEFMCELHALAVAGVDVVDAMDVDAGEDGHGTNTVEEMTESWAV